MAHTKTTSSQQIFTVAFVGLWFLASGALLLKIFHIMPTLEMLLANVGQIAGIGYIGMLIWHFFHKAPSAAELPELSPPLFSKLHFWGTFWLIMAALVFLFAIAIVAHPQLVIVVVLALLGFGFMVRWRQRVTLLIVCYGAGVGLLSFFPGLLNREANGYTILLYLVCPFFLFIGGALMLQQTQLTHIRILENGLLPALRSFGWGCVLAVPRALLNINLGAHQGDTGIDKWFDPIAALTPGIAEEVWARLFLTTLCYALLRPTTNDRPRRALAAAILIGAITHGLAHLPTPMIFSPAGFGFIIAGLLFGVPMGLLFVKRDLEQAIAYHFFIDFVRFLAAYFLLPH
jgi:hypothetical protein